jgi:hypothetical protein
MSRVPGIRLAARAAALLIAVLTIASAAEAQARRTPQRRAPAPAPAPPMPKTEAAMISCPEVVGQGVQTRRNFCDVLIGRDPASGIIITLPPHSGPVTLTFDLHNRATYSDEEVKAHRAYRRFTATIGVLLLDNTLISRAIVQNEYRGSGDLVDRISGGSGPGGVKAVAPSGTESVTMLIPEEADRVSILGEKLIVLSPDGPATFTVSGRPMALISNVMVQYLPPRPVRRAPARRR